ncbi:MAG: sigma-70 family RNA polymerase sigma factor [Bacteroidota bacterium]
MNIVINQYQNSVGDNKLVKQLYEQYAKKLLSYTLNRYSVNEDDAWTLVYKTIYRIADVYDKYSFENEHKQSGFVFKTHINYLRNYFRDNKTFEAKNFEVELDENYFTLKEDVPAKENLQLKVLQLELDQLEEWERILLLMRGQEMPYSDISKFVNKPEKQLKVYYARLKKQLLIRVNDALLKLNELNNGKR